MMPTSVSRIIARVPGIAWVITLIVALLLAGGGALYFSGRKAGRTEVHRGALADSVTHQVAAVDVATQHSERAVAVATDARTRSDRGRAELRTVLADTAAGFPAPINLRIIEQLEQDSTTIAKAFNAIESLEAERVVRIDLDTLRVHQAVLKPPDDGGLSLIDVVKDVAIIVAIVEVALRILHFIRGQ